jgi:hypothetical protein
MAAPGTFSLQDDGLLYGTLPDGTQLPGMTPDMRPELEASGMTFAQGGPTGSAPAAGGGGAPVELPASMRYTGPGATAKGTLPDFRLPDGKPEPSPIPPSMQYTGPGATEAGNLPGRVQKGSVDEPSMVPLTGKAEGVGPVEQYAGRGLPATEDLGVPLTTPAGSASSPARWVDQPLSELRTTQQQVEHSIYADPTTRVGELTGEEIDSDARLSTVQDAIDSGDRREKERDIAAREQLLNREGQLIAKEQLVDKENAKRAEMHAQMRQTDAKRQVYEERVRDAAIDPKRYFRDMGVFSKVLAIVGSALQGYQMGMNGQSGPPPMVGLLQELNKQDIEDQKLEYENAVAQHGRLDNQYQRALEVWGDPELAELQLEKDKLAIADEWIALNEGAAANEMQRFAWQEERGKLQVAQEAINEELQTRKRDKIVSQLQATPKKLVGGGGGTGVPGTKAQKPEPDKIAQAQADLDAANAAIAYAEKYAAENGPDAKLPGYGVGGRIAKGLVSAAQGTGTKEQEEAQMHVKGLAAGLRKPGDSSESDKMDLEKRIVGNGEVGNLYRKAQEAKLNAERRLQAGYGVIPTQ